MFKSFSVFSTLTFACFFLLLLLAASALSNFSLHSVALRSKTGVRHFLSQERESQFRSNSSSLVLLSVKEDVRPAKLRELDPVMAPINVTDEERIAWFKANIPNFNVLKPSELSGQFNERVENFFSGRCEARFFMTWISSARSFGPRELLSLETLFQAHPLGCLLILSTDMDSSQGNRLLKPLIDNGFKVLAAAPDIPYLVKRTPAEAWFDELMKGSVDPGEIPLAQNLSNLLRLLILHRYGGVYLDADVIVLKKLSGLRNTIGAQAMDADTGSWIRLNNAVLIFDKNHPLLFKFVEEFSLTFNGNKWGHNGPYLVSRVVQRVAERPGYNFTVLPPMAFYPVDWTRIGGLFRRPDSPAAAKWVAAKLLQLSGETYAVHLWNKQSRSLRIELGSVMSRIIATHCLFCKHPSVL